MLTSMENIFQRWKDVKDLRKEIQAYERATAALEQS